MLIHNFLTCAKAEIWALTVCIVVNGEKFQSHTVTLTGQCPISNSSDNSNSPAPSKRLLNVLGEPPIQDKKVHQRNADKHDKITSKIIISR